MNGARFLLTERVKQKHLIMEITCQLFEDFEDLQDYVFHKYGKQLKRVADIDKLLRENDWILWERP